MSTDSTGGNPESNQSPRRQATKEQAKAVASEVRLRILRLCLRNPLTNKEIAARLEMNTGTALHHVRKLVDVGFLVPQEPRTGKRGAREIPYLATGVTWELDYGPDTYPETSKAMRDAFVAESEASGGMANSTRFTVRLNEKRRREFFDRVQALFEEYIAEEDTGSGTREYGVYFAAHESER
ncbi:ArsR/SmtB family transcription factor [Salininema proteolyticum]|uniref:ArsR/SmtB family transcription factor n=1 Tax=Salininema proteolyticum TaxID=1607685 RepID=A0ABV8TY86_9ACTN